MTCRLRQTERSRGFGFIRMASVEDAQKCIDSLNGTELQGRRIRVDFSTTHKPHNPTPGAYMGPRRPACKSFSSCAEDIRNPNRHSP
jgi:transformer-2 protein